MQNSLDSINSIHSTHSPNPANVSSPGKRVGECRSNVSSPGKVVGECLSNVSSPGKRVGECLANVSSPGHTRQNGHFGEYSNSTNSPASGHCLVILLFHVLCLFSFCLFFKLFRACSLILLLVQCFIDLRNIVL